MGVSRGDVRDDDRAVEKMDRDAMIKRNFQARGGERGMMDETTKEKEDKVGRSKFASERNVRRRTGCFLTRSSISLHELLCSAISADFKSMALDLAADG